MAERTRTAPERQRTRAPSGRAPPGCDVSELFALLGQPHMLRILAQLNDSGYIVPGLGDAGDRLFGPPD